MRKLLILLAVCLTISLAACTATDTTDTNTKVSGIAATESSDPTGGSVEVTESAEKDEGKAATDATGSDATESDESIQSTFTQTQDNQSGNQTSSKKDDPPKSTTLPPPVVPDPPPESKPPDPPVTLPPPAVFDPQPYVEYAIWYGESIGLTHEPRIGTGSWDSPLNLYAALSEASMKSGIEGRCNSIKNEGKTHFYVEAKPLSDGSYQLYLYYA